MKIGIIGYGEIGTALEKCYLEKRIKPFIKDINRDDGLFCCDILNICIPYSIDQSKNSFSETVSEYIKQLNPKTTIIHSTVIPGTTKLIIKETNNKNIVHSPVRGVHPHLYEGLKTFTKYIGTDQKDLGELVLKHFEEIDIKAEIISNSDSTEMAKILCTTYYGLCIAWHDEVNKLCEVYKTNFDDVMTKWNTSYNDGYDKLNMKNVIRPVLYAPKNGKIGGHCVIPNAELCKSFFESPALDFILKRK